VEEEGDTRIQPYVDYGGVIVNLFFGQHDSTGTRLMAENAQFFLTMEMAITVTPMIHRLAMATAAP